MKTKWVIDAHVHVWTDEVARYPLAAGYSVDRVHPPRFTPDEFLALVNPLGVVRAVLVQMDHYGCDNSYLLDALRQFPGVFSGVAQVDLQSTNLAAELRRLRSLGIRGVRIAPPNRGNVAWLDDPGMQMLWNCAAAERLAICPLIDPDDLPAVFRMCRGFPQTSVVIDHIAGIGSDGQFREDDVQALCELAGLRQAYVKISAFYYLGERRSPYLDLVPIIRRLFDAFGAQRLMWGSDSPFQVLAPHNYRASWELVCDRLGFMSEQDQSWLLYQTAESVFF